MATICSMVAVVIAFFGLKTWRRQLRGTGRYQAATRALKGAYELEFAFAFARDPMLIVDQPKNGAQAQVAARVGAWRGRMDVLFVKVAELRASKFEARAHFGDDVLVPFQTLEELARTLRAEVWLHLWMQGAYAGPGATVDRSPERVAVNDKMIYQLGPEDEFSKSVVAAIAQLEQLLRDSVR